MLDPMRIRHGNPEPSIYIRIVRALFWQRVANLAALLLASGAVCWVVVEVLR